jgi:hypothetical protein
MTTSEKKYIPITKLFDLKEKAYWQGNSADQRLQIIQEQDKPDLNRIIDMVMLKQHYEAFGSIEDYTTYDKRVRRVSDGDSSLYYTMGQYINTIKRSSSKNKLYVMKQEEIPTREDFIDLISEVRTLIKSDLGATYVAENKFDMVAIGETYSSFWDYSAEVKALLPSDFIDNLKVNNKAHYYGDVWGNYDKVRNNLLPKILDMEFAYEVGDEFNNGFTEKIFQYWLGNKVDAVFNSLTGKEITERVSEKDIGLTRKEIEMMLCGRFYGNEVDYERLTRNFDNVIRYLNKGGNIITHSNKRDCYTDTLGVWPKMSKSAPVHKRYNSLVFNKDLFRMMEVEWRPEWEEKAGAKRTEANNASNYQRVTNYVVNAPSDTKKMREKTRLGKELFNTDHEVILKGKVMSLAMDTGLLDELRGKYQPLLYNEDGTKKVLTWEEERMIKNDVYGGKNIWEDFTARSRSFVNINTYNFCYGGTNKVTPTEAEISEARQYAESKNLDMGIFEDINLKIRTVSNALDAAIYDYNAQRDIVRITFANNFNKFILMSDWTFDLNGGDEQ